MLSQGRLAGIDGLRAVAALWVVLFHVHVLSGQPLAGVPGLGLFLRSGSTGVSLFLVISGFCLYLPFAAGRHEHFATLTFLRRRCRRLLPAYFVAVFFALAMNIVGGAWPGYDPLGPSDAVWQLLAHLTVTHSMFPDTFYALNGAFWSLGLEWQLYLALPLLVAGITRFGFLKTALVAVACNVAYRLLLDLAVALGHIDGTSMLATAVLPNQLPGRWAEFVFGMGAAELLRSGHALAWSRRLIWLAPIALTVSLFAVGNPLSHVAFGAFFFIFVVIVSGGQGIIARVATWRPLVVIGVASYSLYLVHQPVLSGLAHMTRTYSLDPTSTFVALLLLMPVVLAVSTVLFYTVERRTLVAQHDRSSATAAARVPGALTGMGTLPTTAGESARARVG